MNGPLKLLTFIIVLGTALASAVIAVISRTTPAQVYQIVEDKQAPLTVRIETICDTVKEIDQRQHKIMKAISRLEITQSEFNQKLDILLRQR